MSRRNRNNRSAAAAADTTPTVEAGTENVPAVDTTSDDAIEAALAAIEAETQTPGAVTVAADEPEAEPEVELDADIEALLAEEAPLTDTPPAETVEDVVENLEAVTEDDVADVIQNDADALLAELDAADATDPVSAAPAPKAPRKKKDASTTAAPTVQKRDFHSVAAIDAATLKTNLDGCNAKKVQEKAQNLIQAIEVGKKLSRYTSVAIKRLVADGKVTGKGLVETLQNEGLSVGTARAQAQQMTALFRIAGIAQPDAAAPRELVIADRGLADELARLAA